MSAEGQAQLHIEFDLSRTVVYVDDVSVVAEARLFYGESDVTDRYLLQEGTSMSWGRESGVSAEDQSWLPTLGATRNILLIEHGPGHPRQDCGSQWENSLSCTFRFTAELHLNYNDTLRISETLNVES